jgi:hypothetical protein
MRAVVSEEGAMNAPGTTTPSMLPRAMRRNHPMKPAKRAFLSVTRAGPEQRLCHAEVYPE